MVTPEPGKLVTVGKFGSGPSGNAEGFRYNPGFAIVSILTRDYLNVLEEVQPFAGEAICLMHFVCFVVFCHDESYDYDGCVGYHYLKETWIFHIFHTSLSVRLLFESHLDPPQDFPI